jgi:hypothetical protein
MIEDVLKAMKICAIMALVIVGSATVMRSARALPFDPCPLPKSVDSAASAADYIVVDTHNIKGRVGWCMNTPRAASTPAGTEQWRIVYYNWRHKLVPMDLNVEDSLDRVRAAPNKASQALIEVKNRSVPLPPQYKCDFAGWELDVCNALTVPPYAGAPLNPVASTYCDGLRNAYSACVAPPPTALTYVVTGSSAYPVNVDGTRSIVAILEKPIFGSTCDCAKKEIVSQITGARYCATSIPNVTQLVVAGCSVKR